MYERVAAVDHRRSVRVQWEDVLLIVPLNREVRILIDFLGEVLPGR